MMPPNLIKQKPAWKVDKKQSLYIISLDCLNVNPEIKAILAMLWGYCIS